MYYKDVGIGITTIIAIISPGYFIYMIIDTVNEFIMVLIFFRLMCIKTSSATLWAFSGLNVGAYSRLSRKYWKATHNAEHTAQNNGKRFLF